MKKIFQLLLENEKGVVYTMSSSIIVYAIGLVAVIYVAYRVYKSATSAGGGCGCGGSKDSGAGCGGCGCGGGHEAEHK
jgi:hypothetical protein